MNIDPKELEMGTGVEHEHTQDEALARKIAMDHLREDPKYYSKLKAAGLEENDEDVSVGSVSPVSPALAIVTIAAPTEDGQDPLSSSGLGQSGTPKQLKSTGLEAPQEKAKVGPNKVLVTKTPPMNGIADPLNHFGSQMIEKW